MAEESTVIFWHFAHHQDFEKPFSEFNDDEADIVAHTMQQIVDSIQKFHQNGISLCNTSFTKKINENYMLVCKTNVREITIDCKLVRRT